MASSTAHSILRLPEKAAHLPFERLWTSVKETLRRRAKYHRALAELRSLSPRELKDIGVARCEIRRLALEESLRN